MNSGFTIIRDTTPAAAIPKGAVVAMGNFDGVHLGHRAVIAAALEMSHSHDKPAFAVTFEPHPRKFFSPNTPQFRLTYAQMAERSAMAAQKGWTKSTDTACALAASAPIGGRHWLRPR